MIADDDPVTDQAARDRLEDPLPDTEEQPRPRSKSRCQCKGCKAP
jgi:hypothetical protein